MCAIVRKSLPRNHRGSLGLLDNWLCCSTLLSTCSSVKTLNANCNNDKRDPTTCTVVLPAGPCTIASSSAASSGDPPASHGSIPWTHRKLRSPGSKCVSTGYSQATGGFWIRRNIEEFRAFIKTLVVAIAAVDPHSASPTACLPGPSGWQTHVETMERSVFHGLQTNPVYKNEHSAYSWSPQ